MHSDLVISTLTIGRLNSLHAPQVVHSSVDCYVYVVSFFQSIHLSLQTNFSRCCLFVIWPVCACACVFILFYASYPISILLFRLSFYDIFCAKEFSQQEMHTSAGHLNAHCSWNIYNKTQTLLCVIFSTFFFLLIYCLSASSRQLKINSRKKTIWSEEHLKYFLKKERLKGKIKCQKRFGISKWNRTNI